MDEHPGVMFREGPSGRRACLIGGPDVWEVIRAVRSARSAEPDLKESEILELVAENTGVVLRLVRAAVDYWAAYPKEVDALVEDANRAEGERLLAWQRTGGFWLSDGGSAARGRDAQWQNREAATAKWPRCVRDRGATESRSAPRRTCAGSRRRRGPRGCHAQHRRLHDVGRLVDQPGPRACGLVAAIDRDVPPGPQLRRRCRCRPGCRGAARGNCLGQARRASWRANLCRLARARPETLSQPQVLCQLAPGCESAARHGAVASHACSVVVRHAGVSSPERSSRVGSGM